MHNVTATITDGERILARDVAAWLKTTDDLPGLVVRWVGAFLLPPSTSFPSGGPFLLTTQDGRTAHILVAASRLKCRGEIRIDFRVVGPFQ